MKCNRCGFGWRAKENGIQECPICGDNLNHDNEMVSIVIVKDEEITCEDKYTNSLKDLCEKAKNGDADAQYWMGKHYYYKQNDKAVVKCYSMAAKQGHVKAITELGNCYLYAIGVSEDTDKAIKLYRKAAELGYADAQNRLGNCYKTGDGVPRDLEKAKYWFEKAAANGHNGSGHVIIR